MVLWALAALASDASFEKAAALLGRLAGVVATAKRQVVVADGAKWVWNAAAELFPNAVCIPLHGSTWVYDKK